MLAWRGLDHWPVADCCSFVSFFSTNRQDKIIISQNNVSNSSGQWKKYDKWKSWHFVWTFIETIYVQIRILYFGVNCSLHSRRLEVVGERENGCAWGWHSRGEGAPAQKAPENRFNSHSVSADISSWWKGSQGKNKLRGARKLSINGTWTT